ncbi:ferredoxin family protein [Herbaspirillum sp. HC18]|nr:ferredoxin family protein [Herbaspirillum sp. HC18]
MAYVVTDSCIRCKHTDCVEACPADAFREGLNFLVIAPDDCIDCGLCVPECPVCAIYPEADVPADQKQFITLNRELAEDWAPIIGKKPALPDAHEWADVKNKLEQLIRS